MEFASAIVDKYSPTHNIVQVTREKAYKLNHPSVKIVDGPMTNLNLFALLQNSDKRILIDSCLQHVAASMNLPSTVLWVGTSPTLFGYKQHNNIVANLPKRANQLIDSSLFDYQFAKMLTNVLIWMLKKYFLKKL
jgi:ADP-heptose:LPS heptosyltransferase